MYFKRKTSPIDMLRLERNYHYGRGAVFFIKRHTITQNNCTESNIYAGATFLCVGFMCKGKSSRYLNVLYENMTTN